VNNDWLDIELLEDYLDGKLDSKAMHKLEKQALEDPFIAQALAGLSESRGRAVQSVSLLQKQLYERIAQQQVTKKETVFTWQRLSVASAAAVMFIAVSIFFFMREREKRDSLSKNEPHTIEVNMAPAPAVIDSAKNESYAANAPVDSTTDPVSAPKIDLKKAIINKTTNPGKAAITQSAKEVVTATDTVTSAATAAVTKASSITARIATVAPSVSTPVGGWANFDSYLSDHNKFKDAKSDKFVELSFLIDTDSHPSDIKVTKSASPEFDEEAIRLIREGPKWEQPKSADLRISYTVAF